jgi:hypothetical protein
MEVESRIISHLDKYITFLFGGENHYDREQKLYKKLLRLEGEELDVWMNTKLKRFITGNVYQDEFEGINNEFEGVVGLIYFASWYHFKFDPDEYGDLMSLDEIFGFGFGEYADEYLLIKEKIQNFQEKIIDYDMKKWKMVFITDYLKMYVQSMSSEELKSHILQLCSFK